MLFRSKTKHEGTYTVIVTSDKGCTSTATTSVTVNTNPNPIATSNVSVCLGDTIRLKVTAGSTYSWTGTGFASTLQEPKIVSTVAGTFTYTVTVSGNGGCSGTATTSVIVNANPTPSATGATVCAGTEIKVNVTPTYSSYAWTGVNSFTASTQNPIVTANAAAINIRWRTADAGARPSPDEPTQNATARRAQFGHRTVDRAPDFRHA